MRKLIILLTIFFASCSTYSENDLGRFDKKIKTWIKKQQKAFKRTESGLYYHFDNEGSGDKIKYTDSVSVIFKGSLLDGTVFEKEEKPLTFAVKEVIVGWKEILLMSKVNSRVQIIVPPQLGYGDHELDKIPQNAILFYQIEIVDIK
jgi:FKBP-type peptidyl-prolyl cis-trans isomerase